MSADGVRRTANRVRDVSMHLETVQKTERWKGAAQIIYFSQNPPKIEHPLGKGIPKGRAGLWRT